MLGTVTVRAAAAAAATVWGVAVLLHEVGGLNVGCGLKARGCLVVRKSVQIDEIQRQTGRCWRCLADWWTDGQRCLLLLLADLVSDGSRSEV